MTHTIIPAGDSLAAFGSAQSNNVWQYAAGVQELAIRQSGRFRQIRNAGVAGNTSSQLLARFQADVLDYNPDVVPILIGTNNYIAGMLDSAYASLFDDVQTLVQMTRAANAIPVVVVPPVKNSAASESRRAVPFFYRLAEYWRVPLADLYKVSVDPVTGNWLAGYSNDGTHPNDTGIAALAPELAAALENVESARCPIYLAAYSQRSAGSPENLITNGSFAYQPTTPGVPYGWTIQGLGSAIYSVTTAAPAPYTGKQFIYNKSAAGPALALSGQTAGVAPGDKILFNGYIGVSSLPATPSGFHVSLDAGGVNLRPFLSWKHNGPFPFSVEMIVPAGKTTVTPTLYVQDPGDYIVCNLTAPNQTVLDAIWAPSGN